jgi:hypothetical protein
VKARRPILILVAGPPMVGIAVSVIAASVGHDAWTARDGFAWFVVGAALGALILVPIAVVEAFRATLSNILGPYAFRIRWYVSLTMAAAMGYLLATMRQGAFDVFAVLAIAIVLVGAMIKMAMDILYEHNGRRTV